MLIRPAQPEDAAAWLAVRGKLWPEHRASHEADIARFFGSKAAGLDAVFLAESAGTIVGFIELSIRPWAEGCESSPVGYVEGWYVSPEGRRQGVGRSLMLAGEQWARDQGFAELASDAEVDNELSRSAHLALGFEDEGLIRCFSKRL